MTTNIFSYMTQDPVRNCPVYKNIGCSHIDGMGCNMNDCTILNKYKQGKLIVDFDNIKDGDWVKDGNGEFWVKIEDADELLSYNLTVNLHSGRVKHASKLVDPVEYVNKLDILNYEEQQND